MFDLHLGITPEPLKLAPKETKEELLAGQTLKERVQTAWFEAVDLTILKLRDNVIVEIQPEISMFGSLKTLDVGLIYYNSLLGSYMHLQLRNNRLTVIPDAIAELMNLVTLDLSCNQLTTLPLDIATLPMLTTLDVSSNQLTALPLSVSSPPPSSSAFKPTSIFAPATIDRATEPLPNLKYLLASNNKLEASNIPTDDLPLHLIKVDLGGNPLGNAEALVGGLSRLTKLKQLLLNNAAVGDESFASVEGFKTLEHLDVGKTKVTEVVRNVFQGRPVSFEGEDIPGGVKIVLGNYIQKEKWEIEAERRARRGRPVVDPIKGDWGVGAESRTRQPQPQAQPIKEDWEIEAEMGLLTEAGRRRARTAAAQVAPTTPPADTPSTPPKSPATVGGSTGQSLAQYYNVRSLTLTLPRSLPPAHSRTRSLAPTVSDGSDPTVPAATLPLPIIVSQSFSHTLRCLVLSNRRFDPSFVLPMDFIESEPLLPALEELSLDNCGLGDIVPISLDSFSASSRRDPIFNILASIFPSLNTLELSDNKLTNMSGIRALLIPDPARKTKGLKALRIRGNKLTDLMGLEVVAQVLQSEGKVESWRLEELDLRDNEIARLPPMLGYLPVDVLLVEGNVFRVPARRVWERDGISIPLLLDIRILIHHLGTKGLLNWLKERVE